MKRLKIGAILSEAFEELRRNSRALLCALSVPAVLIALLDVVVWQQEGSLLVTSMLALPQVFLYALFAVSCHRIILLGPDRLPNPWGVYATSEVWQFAGAVLTFCVIAIFSFLLLGPFLWPLMMIFEGPAAVWVGWFLFMGMALAFLAAMSRVILLFPALAVGSGQNLSDILDLTRSSWLRIALTLGLSMLITTAVSMPLVWMAEASTDVLQAVVPTFISCLIGAYGVAVVSCIYRAHVQDFGPSIRQDLQEPA